jgi:hypothetical protein
MVYNPLKHIAANPKVVQEAWTQSGLANMFDKNTQIAAVEMKARGEIFKVDNPQHVEQSDSEEEEKVGEEAEEEEEEAEEQATADEEAEEEDIEEGENNAKRRKAQ